MVVKKLSVISWYNAIFHHDNTRPHATVIKCQINKNKGVSLEDFTHLLNSSPYISTYSSQMPCSEIYQKDDKRLQIVITNMQYKVTYILCSTFSLSHKLHRVLFIYIWSELSLFKISVRKQLIMSLLLKRTLVSSCDKTTHHLLAD